MIEKRVYKKKSAVYEHLDVSLKRSYAQRLKWLEEAIRFVRKTGKKSRG